MTAATLSAQRSPAPAGPQEDRRRRRRLERQVAFWAARQADAAGRLTAAESELAALEVEL